MNKAKAIDRIHQLGAISERLMMTTRWYPLLVGTFLAVSLITLGKHL